MKKHKGSGILDILSRVAIFLVIGAIIAFLFSGKLSGATFGRVLRVVGKIIFGK